MAIPEVLSPLPAPAPAFPLKRRSQGEEDAVRQVSPRHPTTLTPELKKVTLSRRSQDLSRIKKALDFGLTFEERIDACRRALIASSDRAMPLQERLKLWPKRADPASASGSYICSDGKKPLLVIKPVLQEIGGPHCPTAVDVERTGFIPGDSAPRELLAPLIQKILQFDFGVPEAHLLKLQHPLFGNLKRVGELLEQLKDDVDLSYEKLFELSENAANPEQFVHAVMGPKAKPLTEKAVSAAELERTMKLTRKQAKVVEPLKALFTAFKELSCPDAVDAAVLKFEAHDDSLENLDALQKKRIPHAEFYKFILDIILFNTDGHNGNVLVKKEEEQPNGDYTYRLILIDHGFTLPKPLMKANFAGLKHVTNKFEEWPYALPQASCKIEGELKSKIEALDVSTFISTLKDELQKELKDFYTIDEECYLLLEFNLLLLKRAVSKGATLREMAAFQFACYPNPESEMMAMLRRVVKQDPNGQFSLDRNLARRELEERF